MQVSTSSSQAEVTAQDVALDRHQQLALLTGGAWGPLGCGEQGPMAGLGRAISDCPAEEGWGRDTWVRGVWGTWGGTGQRPPQEDTAVPSLIVLFFLSKWPLGKSGVSLELGSRVLVHRLENRTQPGSPRAHNARQCGPRCPVFSQQQMKLAAENLKEEPREGEEETAA